MKFARAVKNTIVITRLKDKNKFQGLFLNKNSVVSNKPWICDGKNTMIDINLLYKIPKTLDLNTRTFRNNTKENNVIDERYLLGSGLNFDRRRKSDMVLRKL